MAWKSRLAQLIAIGARVGLSARDVRKQWRICQRFAGKSGKAMQRHHVLPKHLFKRGQEALRDDEANLIPVRVRDHRKIHVLYYEAFRRLQDKAALNWNNGDEEMHLLKLKLVATKISVANRGRKFSPERNAKISAALRGNKFNVGKRRSPETCAKLAKAIRAAYQRPEYHEKQRLAAFKRWRRPGYRKKRAAALAAAMQRPSYRANLSAALRGKKLSSEHRVRVSIGTRKAMWRPKNRRKFLAAIRRRDQRRERCPKSVHPA